MTASTTKNNQWSRLWVPFITTTSGQLFSGAFIAVKADMQANPHLQLKQAFQTRFLLNNANRQLLPGILNIYRGNFWNYSYTLGCSFTGNNLAQLTRRFVRRYSDNSYIQTIASGIGAGVAESSWTTNLVARELAKTTGSTLPNFSASYRHIFLSLALRDSLGWIAVQAGALHLENRERSQSVSLTYKISTFLLSGIIGAIISGPADANLRRVYSDRSGRSAYKTFIDAVKRYGLLHTTTAGLKPRIASVAPPFIAYGVAQYWLNKKLVENDMNTQNNITSSF